MKAWKRTWVFLSILALSCSSPGLDPPQDLDPGQAQQWLSQKDAPFLVDVRNPEEFEQEHLTGARLYPLPNLDKTWNSLPQDRPLLLYCHSGRRSQKALDFLRGKGFKNLHQITGGITAWKEKNFPVISDHPTHP